MVNQRNIDLWIAKGASAEDARSLAILYGAPKRADSFLERWQIHHNDWSRVACKARVKKVVTSLEKSCVKIERLYISSTYGSVYIDIVGDITIRVADHERTTPDRARPDFNIVDTETMRNALKELQR